jgi:hypothetical protein
MASIAQGSCLIISTFHMILEATKLINGYYIDTIVNGHKLKSYFGIVICIHIIHLPGTFP